MDRSNKKYVKALKYYSDGYIDKAMDLCEEVMSEDLRNKGALNLKGLLYYLKGDLDSARALWKLNYEVNRDSVSKKYLADTKEDADKLQLFASSLVFIKKLDISGALNILKQCKVSDFNCINVSNSIALCLIKQGAYTKAVPYIEKVLKIDRKNSTALENKKVLIEAGVMKKTENYSVAFLMAAAVIIIGISAFTIYLKSYSKSKISMSSSKVISQVPEYVQQNKKETPGKTADKSPAKEIAFPGAEIEKNIKDKDFDKLYDDIAQWKGKAQGQDNIALMNKCEQLIKNEGIDFFYNSGMNCYKSSDYSKAAQYFMKVYKYGSESFLYPHSVYMLGVSYQKSGNIEQSINYYIQYDNSYATGDYEETALYQLAILYKDSDIDKSKAFAQKLADKFPDSMYNNEVLKTIINK